jgi:alkylmercury lyase
MQGSTADLRELASTILETPTPLTRDERALVRAAYRELMKGTPVTPAHLARAAELPADAVTSAIARLPGLAQVDAEGRIFGFLGLTLRETPHRFVVAGRTLYTWCAWDTLFIPRVLDADAHVQARCPITGRQIRLDITSRGVANVVPGEALMSFQVECEPGGARKPSRSVVNACCGDIHFFSSPAAAGLWHSQHPRGTVLTLDQAWELARLFVDEILVGTPVRPVASSR